jgi:hypothetical protein
MVIPAAISTSTNVKFGGDNMNGAYRYIFLLLLTAALMMPAAMMAARPQRAGV